MDQHNEGLPGDRKIEFALQIAEGRKRVRKAKYRSEWCQLRPEGTVSTSALLLCDLYTG